VCMLSPAYSSLHEDTPQHWVKQLSVSHLRETISSNTVSHKKGCSKHNCHQCSQSKAQPTCKHACVEKQQ